MASREVTLGRLRAALKRLQDKKPERVKLKGKLSLNKINNEAGLGNSYIHKFEDFVNNEAVPAIKEYNDDYDPISIALVCDHDKQTEEDKLKAKLKKEKSLKEQYRKERDDLKLINKELEQQNSSLMFRIFELQSQLRTDNVVNMPHQK